MGEDQWTGRRTAVGFARPFRQNRNEPERCRALTQSPRRHLIDEAAPLEQQLYRDGRACTSCGSCVGVAALVAYAQRSLTNGRDADAASTALGSLFDPRVRYVVDHDGRDDDPVGGANDPALCAHRPDTVG